jgi:hypothetical protein
MNKNQGMRAIVIMTMRIESNSNPQHINMRSGLQRRDLGPYLIKNPQMLGPVIEALGKTVQTY